MSWADQAGEPLTQSVTTLKEAQKIKSEERKRLLKEAEDREHKAFCEKMTRKQEEAEKQKKHREQRAAFEDLCKREEQQRQQRKWQQQQLQQQLLQQQRQQQQQQQQVMRQQQQLQRAAGRGAGRVLPAWKTAQGSADGHAATAAATSVQHVQGQFDDAEQGGRGRGSDTRRHKPEQLNGAESEHKKQPLTKGQRRRARKEDEGVSKQTGLQQPKRTRVRGKGNKARKNEARNASGN